RRELRREIRSGREIRTRGRRERGRTFRVTHSRSNAVTHAVTARVRPRLSVSPSLALLDEALLRLVALLRPAADGEASLRAAPEADDDEHVGELCVCLR